jgi:hypothetical protein
LGAKYRQLLVRRKEADHGDKFHHHWKPAVFFTYVPNGATYFVNVATLDQGTVKTAVDALVKQLDDLSKI